MEWSADQDTTIPQTHGIGPSQLAVARTDEWLGLRGTATLSPRATAQHDGQGTGTRQDGADKECFEAGVAFETGCARGQGMGGMGRRRVRGREVDMRLFVVVVEWRARTENGRRSLMVVHV